MHHASAPSASGNGSPVIVTQKSGALNVAPERLNPFLRLGELSDVGSAGYVSLILAAVVVAPTTGARLA